MTMVFEKQLKILEEKRRIEDLKNALHDLYTEEGLSEEEIEIVERGIKRVTRVPEHIFLEVKEQV
ncbi:hypothetical protein [Bacillus dakarensis]|uniref:hypothetical protein n=1 Tax=Robertmurraya dakarensis TaxID=1926278 RepID=UPI00098249D8|nr:hypothetical protein [Bacillus dakarensis]